MGQQCKCKRGYASIIDNKCSNCRTKKEQEAWLKRPSVALQITVVNKHHGSQGEYIGRGSPLGNEWSHMDKTKASHKVATRAIAVGMYEIWLKDQIAVRNPVVLRELERLGNLALAGPLNLQCFCCPQACHGDVIKQVLFEAISKSFPETHWWLK